MFSVYDNIIGIAQITVKGADNQKEITLSKETHIRPLQGTMLSIIAPDKRFLSEDSDQEPSAQEQW